MYRKMNNFLFRSLSENDKSQIEKLVYEIATESHKHLSDSKSALSTFKITAD